MVLENLIYRCRFLFVNQHKIYVYRKKKTTNGKVFLYTRSKNPQLHRSSCYYDTFYQTSKINLLWRSKIYWWGSRSNTLLFKVWWQTAFSLNLPELLSSPSSPVAQALACRLSRGQGQHPCAPATTPAHGSFVITGVALRHNLYSSIWRAGYVATKSLMQLTERSNSLLHLREWLSWVRNMVWD